MAALGCADLALSVRSSLPGLVAPQLPLSPLPASAPPSARRPPPAAQPPRSSPGLWAPPTALQRLPHRRRRPRLAPPSRESPQGKPASTSPRELSGELSVAITSGH
uniref:classical arabinogalactan protein 4-like n=1 Tax=Odobenus rosmarus divergens TaxID=9708 RepID=UPI00063CDB14|nr:PREDICTED: classical arabinogalactan protein 4-like [Odobenus rosmarus divergens]